MCLKMVLKLSLNTVVKVFKWRIDSDGTSALITWLETISLEEDWRAIVAADDCWRCLLLS